MKSQNFPAKRIKVDATKASSKCIWDSNADELRILAAHADPLESATTHSSSNQNSGAFHGSKTAAKNKASHAADECIVPRAISEVRSSGGVYTLATSCTHSFVIGNKTFCMEVRGLTAGEKPELLEEFLAYKGSQWRIEETFEMVLRDKIQIKHIQELLLLEEALHSDTALSKPLIKHLKKINKYCAAPFCVPRVAASFLQVILGCAMLWKRSLFMQFMATSLAQEVEHFCKLKSAPMFGGGAGSVKGLHGYAADSLLHLSHTKPCIFQLEDLAFVRVIGKGCTGKVFLVKDKATGTLFALKAIHKSWVIHQDEIEHTKAERDILALISSLSHPFLVRLIKSFQTKTDLFLLFEYHPGGDLATHLTKQRKFSPARCKFYAAEIVVGIDRLHRSGVIYRDLKPENVLISRSGHVVLTDFGLSKYFGACRHTTEERRDCGEDGCVKCSAHSDPLSTRMKTLTFCGTAEYLAPEVLLGQAYGVEVDLWSFGTFLYEMLVGITPFWAESTGAMYKRVMNDPLDFPSVGFDRTAKELISGLLQRNPTKRWTVGQIKNCAYFSGVDWKQVEECRMVPPYVPPLHSCDDLSHFDVSFLELPTNLTPTVEVIGSLAQNAFLGFSFESSL